MLAPGEAQRNPGKWRKQGRTREAGDGRDAGAIPGFRCASPGANIRRPLRGLRQEPPSCVGTHGLPPVGLQGFIRKAANPPTTAAPRTGSRGSSFFVPGCSSAPLPGPMGNCWGPSPPARGAACRPRPPHRPRGASRPWSGPAPTLERLAGRGAVADGHRYRVAAATGGRPAVRRMRRLRRLSSGFLPLLGQFLTQGKDVPAQVDPQLIEHHLQGFDLAPQAFGLLDQPFGLVHQWPGHSFTCSRRASIPRSPGASGRNRGCRCRW